MRPFARLAAAVAAASLVIAAGIPVMAAQPSVRWVDDDGRAGPGGCDGTVTVPRRIQPALDAARAGDTVRVCPGTYHERVTLRTREVTLESAITHAATIVPRAADGGGDGAALTVDSAPGAQVIGLAIRIPSAGSPSGCEQERDGILVFDSPGITIRANDVRGTAGRYSGRCGLRNGIELLGSAGATVAWNAVRDWQLMGIAVAAVTSALDAPTVRIVRNSLHWSHRGPICEGLPPCLGPTGFGATPPSGEVFMMTEGIVVDSIASIVRGNAVIATSSTAALTSGIDIYTSRTKVRDNLVRGAEHGLYLAGSGGWATGNDLGDGDEIGIIVRAWGGSPCGVTGPRLGSVAGCAASVAPGARRAAAGPVAPAGVCPAATAGLIGDPCPWRLLRVRGNEVHGYAGYGISTDQSGDRFTGNDVRRNPGIACADASGEPVQNRWTDNTGARSVPAGLCTRTS